MGKQRRYDKQFKQDAVKLLSASKKSVAEVAGDLGIAETRLYQWRKQMGVDGEAAFPGKGRLKPLEEKLRQTERELAGVREERDILKKALAVFSRPSR
jgi:transposase